LAASSDIKRKIVDDDFLQTKFAWMLLAGRVLDQEHGQRGPKVYSLHAPRSNASAKVSLS
jgi:hypothetical protein